MTGSRRALMATAVSLAAASLACVSPDLVTGPTRGGRAEVIGRVVDYQTSAGVANVAVTFGVYGVTTDGFGFYRMNVPGDDYSVIADRELVGAPLRVVDAVFRGDLFVHAGGCTARYGMVVDVFSRRALPGVSVELVGAAATSDASGWYRLDLGCNNSFGTGTVFMTASRTAYAAWSRVAGRREGLHGLERVDIELEPR